MFSGMFCFVIIFYTAIVSSHGRHSPNRKQSEDAHDQAKRIVLQSSGDLLHLIQNLSAELQAVKRNQAKQLNFSAELQVVRDNQAKQETEFTAQITALKGDLAKIQTGAISGGYTAGSYYTNTGAAANYLCLTPNPTWDHYADTVDSGAYVFGTEYEFYYPGNNKHQGSAFFGKNLVEDDAPCSVCRSARSSIIMIPGRNMCYDGWSLEYKGYLVAGLHINDASTEYVCLDAEPDIIAGGQTHNDGAFFYLVEGRCGSLKCPPYVNGRELTCAVCSK